MNSRADRFATCSGRPQCHFQLGLVVSISSDTLAEMENSRILDCSSFKGYLLAFKEREFTSGRNEFQHPRLVMQILKL